MARRAHTAAALALALLCAAAAAAADPPAPPIERALKAKVSGLAGGAAPAAEDPEGGQRQRAEAQAQTPAQAPAQARPVVAAAGGTGGGQTSGGERDAVLGSDAEAQALRERLAAERRELAGKLEEVRAAEDRVGQQIQLVGHVRELRQEARRGENLVAAWRARDGAVRQERDAAIGHANDVRRQVNVVTALRRAAERRLDEQRSQSRLLSSASAEHLAAMRRLGAQEGALGDEEEELKARLQSLASGFAESGLDAWLRAYAEDLPPLLRESVLGAVRSLEPVADSVLDTVEYAAAVDDDLTRGLAAGLAVEDPFIRGSIFHVLLLAPTVAAAWLLFRARALLRHVTLNGHLSTLSLYFCGVCLACAASSFLGGGRDVLISLYEAHPRSASLFVLVHVVAYVIHLAMQALYTVGRHEGVHVAQLVALLCVGMHFFLHGVGRRLVRKDPEVGGDAYLIYSLVYVFILANRSSTFTVPFAKRKFADAVPRPPVPGTVGFSSAVSRRAGRDAPVLPLTVPPPAAPAAADAPSPSPAPPGEQSAVHKGEDCSP